MTRTFSFSDVNVLWMREVVQFFRRPVRLVSLMIQPLLFLFLFGFGLRAAFDVQVEGFDYVLFIIPGLIGQRMITTASRGGMSVMRDRQGGFLKEVLVAPVSRTAVLLGLALGHVTRSLFQGAMLLAVGLWFGMRFGGDVLAPLRVLGIFAAMLLMGLAIVHLSFAIAWRMDDPQLYATVSAWLVLPLFLLSGGLFPVSGLPWWLGWPIRLNPLTYAVDAMRSLALGPGAAHFPLWLDFVAIGGFFALATLVAVRVMREAYD